MLEPLSGECLPSPLPPLPANTLPADAQKCVKGSVCLLKWVLCPNAEAVPEPTLPYIFAIRPKKSRAVCLKLAKLVPRSSHPDTSGWKNTARKPARKPQRCLRRAPVGVWEGGRRVGGGAWAAGRWRFRPWRWHFVTARLPWRCAVAVLPGFGSGAVARMGFNAASVTSGTSSQTKRRPT